MELAVKLVQSSSIETAFQVMRDIAVSEQRFLLLQ
jgi:hypothetical protein